VSESGIHNPPTPGHAVEAAGEHPSRQENPRIVSRRWMLMKAGIALNGLVGIILAIPIVRYLLWPVHRDSFYKSWVSLGGLEQFPVGQTRLTTFRQPYTRPWDGPTEDIPCYVRRTGKQNFQVFAVNCAHLGCPVRWFPQSQLFMCPCHGGVYYANGDRASGPPERGLFQYDYKIVSGALQINAGQMPTLSNTAKLVNIALPSQNGGSQCRG
jgi:nitrite reductase/ring-hydroxylating ferredoxin subunit